MSWRHRDFSIPLVLCETFIRPVLTTGPNDLHGSSLNLSLIDLIDSTDFDEFKIWSTRRRPKFRQNDENYRVEYKNNFRVHAATFFPQKKIKQVFVF